MNDYLSEKIKVLSFLLMIMVVCLHSYNLVVISVSGTTILNTGYSLFIQDFFSQGILRIAVPLFFIISGYLFFLKTTGTLVEFKLKWRKKIKTLVLPYLFWSLWGLLFYCALQTIPQSKPFFTKELIRDYSGIQLLTTIFIKPIPYQLWFVRDLMVMVLLSPLIYTLIKYLQFFAVLILFGLWLFDIDLQVIANQALFFFVLGAYFSRYKSNLLLKDFSKKYWIYTCIWLAIVLCRTILAYINFENTILLNIIYKVSILIGIPAIWSLYDFLFKNKKVSNYPFYFVTSFSFFLYVFHEPLLTIIKKVLFTLMGKGELASVSIYVIAPLLTIPMSIFIAYYLKQITPKFYQLITGER